ncbi:nuclear transport factor 2 family protein [Pseudonocardia nigra]|uniref:nuclear transport factor 2 family protein n=1 Tax=Pseudonocardia nigra TaxID=1921578 RepID=UPI001C5ECFAE|nr:nuclear transport factor 2 family protein [Pseudonocardia nigra]
MPDNPGNTVNPGNAVTVRRAYDAFARGDIPAVLAAMDPGIVWYSPEELPFGGRFEGPEEVVGFFRSLGETFDALEVVPDRILDAGPDHVVVEGRDVVTLGGERLEIGFLHLVTLHAGRITAFREYADTGKLLRHLDAATAAG